MNEAIKLAIETGGYSPNAFTGADWTVEMVRAKQCDAKTLLDPFFWQALGKALGWKGNHVQVVYTQADISRVIPGDVGMVGIPYPRYHWHRFIDWIADGKDADEFFVELLNPVQAG